jgi:hypothetical protein
MDVTRILLELHSELENIKRAILSLENFDRLTAKGARSTARDATKITRGRNPLVQEATNRARSA